MDETLYARQNNTGSSVGISNIPTPPSTLGREWLRIGKLSIHIKSHALHAHYVYTLTHAEIRFYTDTCTVLNIAISDVIFYEGS